MSWRFLVLLTSTGSIVFFLGTTEVEPPILALPDMSFYDVGPDLFASSKTGRYSPATSDKPGTERPMLL
jgi:hypothetical protein